MIEAVTMTPAGSGPPALTILPTLDQIRIVDWAVADAPLLGIYGFDSRDIRSRSFNLLRSRVSRLMAKNGWRTLGIVSATPGAGKSFVSSNLAAAFARLPRNQVYLFDLDLRRSTVAPNFGLQPQVGLNDFLAGRTDDLGDVAMRLGDEDLVIFPSIASMESSAELVAGDRMKQIVDDMRRLPSGTLSICDLPPVFANDDAAIVVSALDAYLLIVEEGQTTAKQISDTIGILSPSICAGTVLNRYSGGLTGTDYGYGQGRGEAYESYFKS